MKHLKVKTEYGFKKTYGRVNDLVAIDGVVGISDSGTWGHVAFYKACEKADKKAVLGVELPVVDTLDKGKKQSPNYMTFFAKNNAGLSKLYELVSLANQQFYYFPRLLYVQLAAYTEDMIVLSGTTPNLNLFQNMKGELYLEAGTADLGWAKRTVSISKNLGIPIVAVSDNKYGIPEQKDAYFIMAGMMGDEQSMGGHVCDEDTLRSIMPWLPDNAYTNSDVIYNHCTVTLPKAENVKYPFEGKTLRQLCIDGAKNKDIDISPDTEYGQRLERELQLIADKNYTDYFLVVADMIEAAKETMLVGPSRGSSAGSLVCFLTRITEIDPIEHGLIFERFIDINRFDMPDIDIDFPDVKRQDVIDNLSKKYGADKVAHIGTISRYKPKSAIAETAKELGVDFLETEAVKNSIIDRSLADARASMCIQDTLESTDVGKQYITKFPEMAASYWLEGHARHSGVHAAGILVANESINKFCTVDPKVGVAQIDKHDAEDLNLLKIDVLGLRTLSVLEMACDLADMDYNDLYTLPTDDQKVFDLLNDGRLSGVFQFEGYALKSLARQMVVEEFNDIVAITSLARPGPLHNGGATDYVNRRTGREHVSYIHPSIEPFTSETYGTVVYQEQVMNIVRALGKFSWADTTSIRKGMAKSMGDDYLNKFWEKFVAGCISDGMDELTAMKIWKNIMTFGSWAFNKSHAVSYALISYWCGYMKAHYPLEYAVACLNNARDDDQGVKILRELVKEGFEYKPVDIVKSKAMWSVVDGMLIGGLMNIKGIGEKMAADIFKRRSNGDMLTKGQMNKLTSPVTPFDDIFEAKRRFGDIYANPKNHNIKTMPVSYIIDVQETGMYIVIAKLKEKNLRDLNEYASVVKRGGKLIKQNPLFLNMTMEDDTDSIIVTVSRWNYQKYGKEIAETGKEGDWFLIKGEVKDNWRKIYVKQLRKLS